MLHVHHGNDLHALAIECARRVPLSGPLMPRHVVVPSNAMAKWLSLQIASENQISANLQFHSPAQFIAGFCNGVWRQQGIQQDLNDWLNPATLAWKILALFASAKSGLAAGSPAGQPVGQLALPAILTRFFNQSGDPSAGVSLAQALARQFSDYLIYRTDVLQGWESGSDSGWQATLWQLLTRRADFFPAQGIVQALATEPNTAGVASEGEKVSIFGLPAASPLLLDVVEAKNRAGVDVDLYVLSPTRDYWADTLTPRQVAESGLPQDQARIAMGHPLLASLGQQGREYHALWVDRFAGSGQDTEHYRIPAPDSTLQTRGSAGSQWLGSVLECLKMDLLDLTLDSDQELNQQGDEQHESTPNAALPGDRSVQIHACHGPMREAQVLHDQLLDLFARHKDLQPEQVAILVPDMATYGPLLEAEFNAQGKIPFAMIEQGAARAARQATGDQVGEAFSAALTLAQGRLTASEVMAVIASEPVRVRHGLSPDDVAVTREWLNEAAIRWGADSEMRAQLGLPPSAGSTWQEGGDRLLLGYAMGPEQSFQELISARGLQGSEALLGGRWLALVERLLKWYHDARGERAVAVWSRLLHKLADDLLIDQGSEGVRKAIRSLDEMSERAGITEPLPLSWVSKLMGTLLTSNAMPATFLAGGVTIADARLMRGIPFRVICMPGLNSGSFPVQDQRPAYDLLQRDPRRGDRSRRSDDQWLFVETLVSAREALVLSFDGRSLHTNTEQAPASVVKELVDELQRRWKLPSGDKNPWIVNHPLSPRSPDYFKSADVPPGSYSARRAEQAIQLNQESKQSYSPLPNGPVDPSATALQGEQPGEVDLSQLQSFFRNPARYLLQRCGVYQHRHQSLVDQELFNLEGLQSYQLRNRILDGLLENRDLDHLLLSLQAADILPQGLPGTQIGKQVLHDCQAQLAQLSASASPDPVAFQFTLRGMDVTGVLRGTGEAGMQWLSPSKSGPAHGLSWWLAHLCWNLVRPEPQDRSSLCVFADGKLLRLAPVAHSEQCLADLLELFIHGQDRLLLFEPRLASKAVSAGEKKNQEQIISMLRNDWNNPWMQKADWYWTQLVSDDSWLDGQFLQLASRVYQPFLDAQVALS